MPHFFDPWRDKLMSSEPPAATTDALNPAFSAEGLRQAVRHGSRRTCLRSWLRTSFRW